MQKLVCFKKIATDLFTKGDSCSEAVIRAAYECGIIDNKTDIELLNKIASPFAGGAGTNGCICGALAGAQMIIGCLIGRNDISYPNDKLKSVSKTIVEEFKKRGRPTCCRASLPEFCESLEERHHNCVATIEDAIDILNEQLLQHIEFKTPV